MRKINYLFYALECFKSSCILRLQDGLKFKDLIAVVFDRGERVFGILFFFFF